MEADQSDSDDETLEFSIEVVTSDEDDGSVSSGSSLVETEGQVESSLNGVEGDVINKQEVDGSSEQQQPEESISTSDNTETGSTVAVPESGQLVPEESQDSEQQCQQVGQENLATKEVQTGLEQESSDHQQQETKTTPSVYDTKESISPSIQTDEKETVIVASELDESVLIAAREKAQEATETIARPDEKENGSQSNLDIGLEEIASSNIQLNDDANHCEPTDSSLQVANSKQDSAQKFPLIENEKSDHIELDPIVNSPNEADIEETKSEQDVINNLAQNIGHLVTEDSQNEAIILEPQTLPAECKNTDESPSQFDAVSVEENGETTSTSTAIQNPDPNSIQNELVESADLSSTRSDEKAAVACLRENNDQVESQSEAEAQQLASNVISTECIEASIAAGTDDNAILNHQIVEETAEKRNETVLAAPPASPAIEDTSTIESAIGDKGSDEQSIVNTAVCPLSINVDQASNNEPKINTDAEKNRPTCTEERVGDLEIPKSSSGQHAAIDDERGRDDETTPIPLGSPDIQINDNNDNIKNDDRVFETGSDLDGGAYEQDKHPDAQDQETDVREFGRDCCTPTPQQQHSIGDSLLDPNSLYNFLSPFRDGQQQQQPDGPDSDDELEAEFDNEPEFEPRHVELKRGMEPGQYYEFGDELGRGRFGTVFKVRDKSCNLELAAKMILIRRQSDLKDVEREIAIMSLLQHPRLLQLYDAFVDCPSNASGANQICLITELIEGGELFERIVDDDFNLTEKKAAIFMRQICEGVEYMHKMGVVHLDMKPENILCVSKTSNRIKLIDFGLARKLEPGESLRVMFGTPDFAAPEVLSYDVVSYATDMWSVGVICYVLLSGLSPFMGDSDVETMANVQRATFDFDSDAFDPITDLAKDFISRLLVREPKLRLKPRECLEHAWLQKGGRLLEAAVRSRRESMVSIMSIKSDNFDLTGFGGGLSGIASLTSLNKRNLKKYVVRRKWHRTVHAIMALRRMGANLKQKLIGQIN